MVSKTNYLKVIMEITDKASQTYSKFQAYKTDPVNFKLKEPNLFLTFKMADNLLSTAKGYMSSAKTHDINESRSYTSDKCYEILESSKKDSNEIIKANYKRLVKEYHPDTISGKNLPKGFIEFASNRFQEIHVAYESIKKERKFK
jgi:DnaJ-domain-containing protein 1